MRKSIEYSRDLAEKMSDAELLSIFDRIKPAEEVSPLKQAVIDEIERRGLNVRPYARG